MQLIVFVGPKGCGKDTAADLLKKNKKSSGKISFALPLKRICSTVFEVPMRFFVDVSLKDKPFKEPVKVTIKQLRNLKIEMLRYVDPYEEGKAHNLNKIPASRFLNVEYKTPRELLQQIGTQLIRENVHQNWHCMAAFGETNKTLIKAQDNLTYCITDCRFVNEYEYLKRTYPNAYFFYIDRPKAEKVLTEATHASELETLKVKGLVLQDGGEVLFNNKSLKEFESKLKKLDVSKREVEIFNESEAKVGKFKFARRG